MKLIFMYCGKNISQIKTNYLGLYVLYVLFKIHVQIERQHNLLVSKYRNI